MKLNIEEIQKFWDWTDEDINALFKPFIIDRNAGRGGSGPSNGYSVYLFCMMDFWGSIFNNRFNVHKKSTDNTADFLTRLRTVNAVMYDFGDIPIIKVADELRNNIVHNYGYRVLDTGNQREKLNIDINSNQQIINVQQTNNRWHIDCMRLKDDMLAVIETWLIENNYLDNKMEKYGKERLRKLG